MLTVSIPANKSPCCFAVNKGIEIGYAIMNGNAPEEKTILIPVELITRDNVNDYQGWIAE